MAKPPRSLPDEAAAGGGDIDPAHIIALATRIGNLDEEIAALRQQVAELDNDLADRLPTKEQHTEIVAILQERAGRKWFQSQLRFYGWGLLALLVGIFAIGDKLSQFATWLAAVLKR